MRPKNGRRQQLVSDACRRGRFPRPCFRKARLIKNSSFGLPLLRLQQQQVLLRCKLDRVYGQTVIVNAGDQRVYKALGRIGS